ncbi:putative RNA-directed DNA polymerase from transposon BS [Trichonephila clavipes]|nr:putative RNA-directed DNA polymerase from transposon BS [Trichonephila clavipes]
MLLCPGKGLVLPNQLHVDQIATNVRFLLIPLQNVEMSKKSPFAIHKALIGIGGEPKTVKRLRSGDILIETHTALQTKSFLLAHTFLDSPVTICPHKSLNTSRGVISESDLLSTPESEILEGFSDQGVIQVRRITIKKDATIIPTKHLILTFNRPKLPHAIKAGYLNCKIRPYVPNPLRCFKCQRFGHSQTSCRGQLTCSRCASVGHSSTDCTLEPKCINCAQSHPSDSKICPKWNLEKQIQEIKANKNISYPDARKLIVPQSSQTYAQAAKSSTKNSSSQTDENITKIKCSPLKLLEPFSSKPKPNASISTPNVSRSSSSTQAQLLLSTSSIPTAYSESQPPIPTSNDAPSTDDMFTPIGTSSPIIPTSSSHSVIQPPSASNIQDTKKISKVRARKRKKEILKKMKDTVFEIKMAQHRPRKPASVEYTTDEEDTIVYDMGEEIESPKNRNTVGEPKKDIAKYTCITPTKYKNKSTVAPVVFQRVFAYHRSQYSRYSAIYTDGSKRADYVGCGVVIEDIMHGYRLDTSCSIFTAEAVAIYRALQ